MVGSTRQTTAMMKMVNVRSISWGASGHAMSCLRWVVSLGVCWWTPTYHVWKLENYLLRLWRINVDIEIVLWSPYISITTMLEMLHMWCMLISASRQRCLMNVRWVAATLSIILMHLRHRIVLHVAPTTLLRMSRNMMMYMWMDNVTSTVLLTISELVVYLYARLLILVRIIIALLIFIRNQLRLTIIFSLSILARLQSTKKWPRMIARPVSLILIDWSLNLRSGIGVLLLAFHDNILKKLDSFLHAISLIQPIGLAWLPSLSESCIGLLILRLINFHRLVIQLLLLVIWNINLLLVPVKGFLVCALLGKELFLLGISLHLSSFFYLSFPWWL